MNYGLIQDLTVRDREPILTSCPPLVLTDIRLDVEERPREELSLNDFNLCVEFPGCFRYWTGSRTEVTSDFERTISPRGGRLLRRPPFRPWIGALVASQRCRTLRPGLASCRSDGAELRSDV
jgi:hypothetical protein